MEQDTKGEITGAGTATLSSRGTRAVASSTPTWWRIWIDGHGLEDMDMELLVTTPRIY